MFYVFLVLALFLRILIENKVENRRWLIIAGAIVVVSF